MTSVDPRIARAERRLDDLGFRTARVEIAGHEWEIAVLLAEGTERGRLLGAEGATVARALKQVGFRYVTLDLAPASPGTSSARMNAGSADDRPRPA